MGNYQIWIGITAEGWPQIGADCTGDCEEREKVFGVQIAHRCAALVDGNWRLMTPTAARKAGATEIRRFPGRR